MNTPVIEQKEISLSERKLFADERKIFIVAHHDFSVDGIISILQSRNDRHLVACIEPGFSCFNKFIEAKPDLLLVHNDIIESGIEEYFDNLFNSHPTVKILVFGQGMKDDFLYRLVRSGVHGYINEKMNGDHLIRAITEIELGGLWIERHVSQRFVKTKIEESRGIAAQYQTNLSDLGQKLTNREAEVLKYVMKGMTTKDIADEVSVSHQCIKLHLGKLFKKFDVSNRPQLIITAYNQITPIRDLDMLVENGLNRDHTKANKAG